MPDLYETLAALGGMAHTRDLLAADVHPREVYAARDDGRIIEVTRGVFRLPSLPFSEPDLLVVATRAPKAVLCLTTAMHMHGITNEIPKAVHLALPRGVHPPRLDFPPLEVYHYSEESYAHGVESQLVDGAQVRLTTVAKTVADGFKFRSRIGHDVAVTALREVLRSGLATPALIMEAAFVCRVHRVMAPYLEALQ